MGIFLYNSRLNRKKKTVKSEKNHEFLENSTQNYQKILKNTVIWAKNTFLKLFLSKFSDLNFKNQS